MSVKLSEFPVNLRALIIALSIMAIAQAGKTVAEVDVNNPPAVPAGGTAALQQPADCAAADHAFVAADNAMTGMSGRDRFRVTVHSNVDPVPLSRMHSWSVHIETAGGEPVADADIGVYGSMPAHKHGLPSRPRLTENRGCGNYLVEGVKFTMPGTWELIFIITADGQRDKAKFRIELP